MPSPNAFASFILTVYATLRIPLREFFVVASIFPCTLVLKLLIEIDFYKRWTFPLAQDLTRQRCMATHTHTFVVLTNVRIFRCFARLTSGKAVFVGKNFRVTLRRLRVLLPLSSLLFNFFVYCSMPVLFVA